MYSIGGIAPIVVVLGVSALDTDEQIKIVLMISDCWLCCRRMDLQSVLPPSGEVSRTEDECNEPVAWDLCPDAWSLATGEQEAP